MQPSLVATRRGPMEVAELGAGPPLVVVHGMPGDWSQAAPIARELADAHRVLLVSRPGYGRTPLSTGPGWDATGDAFAAVLDTLAIDRAAVIGISGGGPSSAAFAARHPERCAGLVLCCAVHPDVQPIPALLRIVHRLPGVRDLLVRIAHRREVAALRNPDRVIERALADANERERAAVAADPVALSNLVDFLHHHARVSRDLRPFRADLEALVAHQRARHPLAMRFDAGLPSLVAHGDADQVVPLASAERWHRDLPGSRLEVLPGAGHAFLFTFREHSMDLLRTFLADAGEHR